MIENLISIRRDKQTTIESDISDRPSSKKYENQEFSSWFGQGDDVPYDQCCWDGYSGVKHEEANTHKDWGHEMNYAFEIVEKESGEADKVARLHSACEVSAAQRVSSVSTKDNE